MTEVFKSIGCGVNIADGQQNAILQIKAETLGRWTYYNANSGSQSLPTGEIWGFGLQLGFSGIYIVLYISGTSGKIYHAVYNNSWSPWYEH